MKTLYNEQGSALIVVLALLAIFGVLAISTVDRSNTEIEMSYNQLHEEQAFYLAEAGAYQALAELNNDIDWRDGFKEVPMGKGVFTVVVSDSSVDVALDDSIKIVSEGTVDRCRASVELLVGPDINYPFQNAMFGEDSVDMKNSFNTDSYNSDSGSFASTFLDSLGDVGSNGDILVRNGTVVGGSVVTSLPGGLDINIGATINGIEDDTAPYQDLPVVTQDEYDLAEVTNDNATGITGSYSYDPTTYAFGSSGAVELSSGTYFFSSIVLKNSASLTIAPGASVKIYVTGDIDLKNAAEMNATGDPSDLLILSQGDLKLSNSGDMNVLFYSPTGLADLKNSGDFYGSIVARSIMAHNSAGFHYDRSLSDYTFDEDFTYEIVAWKELQ